MLLIQSQSLPPSGRLLSDLEHPLLFMLLPELGLFLELGFFLLFYLAHSCLLLGLKQLSLFFYFGSKLNLLLLGCYFFEDLLAQSGQFGKSGVMPLLKALEVVFWLLLFFVLSELN